MLINGHHEDVPFTLPPHYEQKEWAARFDTSHDHGQPDQQAWRAGEVYPLAARSMVVFTQEPG